MVRGIKEGERRERDHSQEKNSEIPKRGREEEKKEEKRRREKRGRRRSE